ncbi:MAG: T9SS type A sorting domain-containing protein [Saprospiraceae bacterium]|nr:T9SS type A sorting domain-containing protein [Saprospiraceae bacterium]
MKNFIYITCLIIFYSLQIFAQLNLPVEPFEQIKWKNLSPKWHITEYDESMLSDSCDGYNYFFNLDNDPKKLFIGNEYITTYYLRGKRTTPSGHYLVKRNLDTGVKIWSVREDHTMTGLRTNITRALFLDENTNIIHVGLVPLHTYPKDPSGFLSDLETQFSKKVLDLNSGLTISSYFPDNADSSVVILPQAVFKYGPYNHLYKEGNNYRCIYPVKYNDKLDFKLVSQLVDEEGRRVGATDSIPFYEGERFVNFTRINEDTFLYIESKKLTDSLIFNFVDKNLKTLKKIRIQETIPINDMLLTAYQHEKLIFTSFDTKTDPFEPPVSQVVYDLKGNRLMNAKIDLEYHQIYPLPFYYKRTNELFEFTLYAKKISTGNWDFSMNIYKLLQDSMILISSFKAEDPDRFVYVNGIDELPSGDILLEIQENNMIWKENKYQQDGNARAMSTMRVSPEALGLIPVSTNTEFIADQLNLYPNPSSGPVRIVFPNGINEGKLEIFNSSGALVMSRDFDKHLSNFFEFEGLPSGMYLIKAIDKTGKSAVGKLVVTE